jgi:hypothetical protein
MPDTYSLPDTYRGWRRWLATSTATTSVTWLWNLADSTTSSSIIDDGVWLATAYPERVRDPTRRVGRPRVEAREQRVRVEAARRHEAEVKAELLLLAHLDPVQREDYLSHGWFVAVARSGRRYRIHRGREHNIFALDGDADRALERLCCHPVMPVPDQDTMLTQLLWLTTDEPAFRRIANITRLARTAP